MSRLSDQSVSSRVSCRLLTMWLPRSLFPTTFMINLFPFSSGCSFSLYILFYLTLSPTPLSLQFYHLLFLCHLLCVFPSEWQDVFPFLSFSSLSSAFDYGTPSQAHWYISPPKYSHSVLLANPLLSYSLFPPLFP